jgi:hypothetical protein
MDGLRFLRFPLLVAVLCTGACAGGATSERGAAAVEEEPAVLPDAEPVTGNVAVSWRNLDPRNQATMLGLVNESSSTGRDLRMGKTSSSSVRVLSDVEMGQLLAELRRVGFFEYARDGLDANAAAEVPGKKGIVVVEQDGVTKGLLLTTGMGTSAVPKVYLASKERVYKAHASVMGAEVKVSVGPADDRIFSPPPIKMKRP